MIENIIVFGGLAFMLIFFLFNIRADQQKFERERQDKEKKALENGATHYLISFDIYLRYQDGQLQAWDGVEWGNVTRLSNPKLIVEIKNESNH